MGWVWQFDFSQGATTEELETRYRDAERKYAAAKKDIKDLSDLQKVSILRAQPGAC